MHQILFQVPVPFVGDVPISGYGVMLFITFVACTWLAGRRAERVGIPKERIQDLAIWVFLCGVAGARIVYMIQYKEPIQNFFKIWQGGIVFYGSAIGGWIGYLLFRKFTKHFSVSTWELADVIAPTVAMGLMFGRFGCLLNGCCYGHVAGPDEIGIRFPLLSNSARIKLVYDGDQTAAGFAMSDTARDGRTVGVVDPDSGAMSAPDENKRLKPGDVIVAVDGTPVANYGEIAAILLGDRRGNDSIQLTVLRDDKQVELAPYTPHTLPLHPTQIYESISMALLFVVLLLFYPIRRHNGQVFVLLMLGYSVHRFLNEQLRNDTDTVAFGLTLSQNISLLIFATAIGLELYLRKTQPVRTPPTKPTAPVRVAAGAGKP
jgi:phosphatidylglycerol:prolipoprotein diacylglycerol transferase